MPVSLDHAMSILDEPKSSSEAYAVSPPQLEPAPAVHP